MKMWKQINEIQERSWFRCQVILYATNVVWKSTNKALGFRTMWQEMKFVMQFNVILNSREKYWSAKLLQRVDLSHKNAFVDLLQNSSDLRTKDACRENFTLGELWNLAWKTKTNQKIFALATAIFPSMWIHPWLYKLEKLLSRKIVLRKKVSFLKVTKTNSINNESLDPRGGHTD